MNKFYKDLTIDEKINVKSWGFWRLPNKHGFFATMIDNANSFERKDYVQFTNAHLCKSYNYLMPRNNVKYGSGLFTKLFRDWVK